MNDDCIIRCSDYREFAKEICNGSVDLMVVDIPYDYSVNGNWLKSAKHGTKSKLAQSETFRTDGDLYTTMANFGVEEVREFLEICLKKCKIPNSYIFCSETQVPVIGMWAREHGLKFQLLVWEKPLSIISKDRLSTHAEYVCRVYGDGLHINRLDINSLYSKVIHDKPVQDKRHPTEKPVSIMEKFILLSSNEGDLIYDPFFGSGTTAVAALKNKRRFVGSEMNPKYVKIANERVNAQKAQTTLF